MRIVQWNIRGYYGNFEDLKLMLKDSQFPACVCLQETLINSRKPFPPSRYYIYSHQPAQPLRPPRGIAMLINKKVPHSIININSNLEIQAIKVHLRKTYTIVNVYISLQEQLSSQQIESVISQISPPYLIVGDFNARSPIWGDSTENGNGRAIERLLASSNVRSYNSIFWKPNPLSCPDKLGILY